MKCKVAMIEPVGGHGGMDYYDLSLCHALSACGCQPHYYTSVLHAVPDNLPVRLFFRKVYGKAPKLFRLCHWVGAMCRSLTDARRNGISLVHLHFFDTGFLELLTLVLIKLFLMKVVVTLHDIESFHGKSSKRISNLIISLIDTVIVHNDFSHREFRQQFGGEVPVAVIPHGNYLSSIGVRCSKQESRALLALPPNDPVLLIFGQIKKVKGIEVALKALPSLIKDFPNLKLLIAGKLRDGDFGAYDALIDDLALQENVIKHIRYIPNDMVDHYYNASDIVLLPYHRIYQSGALLLAMSYGKAVIASDLPAMKEVLKTEELGLLFQENSAAALAQRCRELLAAEEKRELVGEAARDLMTREYDWHKIAQRTVSAYREVLVQGKK